MNVAVVGASQNPERYSHKAVLLLIQNGHCPIPVHPTVEEVAGLPTFKTLDAIDVPIDTVSIYLSAKNQNELEQGIRVCQAKRVIFNPGTENPVLEEQLRAAGIEVMEACTLVLLNTGQF